MCEGAPVQPIVMIFDAAREFAELINHANFCFDRFKGFGLRKGQNWGPAIGNRNGLKGLPLCVAPAHT